MAKYIDANKLLTEAKELSGPITGDGWDNWGVYSLIERQPAADVVEIVRCKDCKHYYNDADCGMACEFTNMSQPEDGFCNWAERKDKNNG